VDLVVSTSEDAGTIEALIELDPEVADAEPKVELAQPLAATTAANIGTRQAVPFIIKLLLNPNIHR
jgi:hypothetical protein